MTISDREPGQVQAGAEAKWEDHPGVVFRTLSNWQEVENAGLHRYRSESEKRVLLLNRVVPRI